MATMEVTLEASLRVICASTWQGWVPLLSFLEEN